MQQRGAAGNPGPLVGRGRTSDVFALGADAVVKVPRPGVPAHWARMEAEMTHAVHALGVPTPAVLDVVVVGGRESVVFSRIDGPSAWQRVLADPRELAELARVLADIHIEIRQVVAPVALPRFRDRACTKVREAEALPAKERASAHALAASLPDGSALCHGDLHPGNILMSRRGPVVIDWFDAGAGQPIADVARTSLLVRPPSRSRVALPHLPGATAALLDQLHLEYLRNVLAAGELDTRSALGWERVLAVGRLAERAQGNEADLIAVWLGSAESATPLSRALDVLAVPEDQLAQ